MCFFFLFFFSSFRGRGRMRGRKGVILFFWGGWGGGELKSPFGKKNLLLFFASFRYNTNRNRPQSPYSISIDFTKGRVNNLSPKEGSENEVKRIDLIDGGWE